MKKICLHILVVLLAFNSSVLKAQKVSVHFEGTIYDEDNVVIRGALVEITKGELLFNSLKADENGNYNLYLPLDGDYDVTISKAGYVQKKYFVSTKNIPADKSQIQFATNVADIVLLTKYDGIDYGLFQRPMNKYAYNIAKDNVTYDEEYLKEMKVALKEFKHKEGEALKLAKQKALAEKAEADRLAMEKAKKDKLLAEKQAIEKAKSDQIAEAKHIEEIKQEMAKNAAAEAAKKKAANAQVVSDVTIDQKPGKTVVSSSTVIKNSDPRIMALLGKYKPGITEEVFEGNGVYVIQRVLVRDDMVWVYQKKVFSWGGVSFFRDKQPITESTFEGETNKSYVSR